MDKKLLKWFNISILVVLCILFLIYGYYHAVDIDSDYASQVLEANDILHGDIFLHDWFQTGVSFFTTQIPFFVLGVLFFGVSENAYIFASVATYFVLAIFSLLLIKHKKNNLLNILILMVFVLFPSVFTMNVSRAHTVAFAFGFLIIFLFVFLKEKNLIPYGKKTITAKTQTLAFASLYIIILALSTMGDPIVLMVTLIPLCIWTIISWIIKETETGQMLFNLFINVAGMTLGLLLDKFYYLIGGAEKNAILNQVGFVNFYEIPNKLIVYFSGILKMLNADFQNQVVLTFKTMLVLFGILAIILFLVLIFYNIVSFIAKKKYDCITVILGFGFLILSLAFIFTNISSDLETLRYICYFPTILAIVFIRNFTCGNRRLYGLLIFVLLILLCGNIINLKDTVATDKEEHKSLAKFLENNNLKTGYAAFWHASIITVLSKEKVKVRAIEVENNKVLACNWYCKKTWYEQYADFVIIKEEDIKENQYEFNVSSDNIIKNLGYPMQALKYEKYRIFLYNRDISKDLCK